MGVAALCLDLLGACIACMSILLLSDVAALMPTRGLKRAWRALFVVVVCCIACLLVSATAGFGKEPDIAKLADLGIHVLGPLFVFAIAWLSRRTAHDLLRIQQLEEAAFRDPLTGLGNRRRFDACLAVELARMRAAGQQFSLIVLDIDHFKSINDTYGHEGGDSVLRQMGGIIGAVTRPADTLCRIGGEEFVMIAPGLDAPFAAMLAERIRLAVSGSAFPIDDCREVHCTISIGFATASLGESADGLFRRADAALYASKRGGRDRVSRAA